MGTIDQELLYTIRAMTVLLSTGAGLETTMKFIADNDYGEISIIFDEVLKRALSQGTLAEALKEIQGKYESKGFNKLISTMIISQKGDTNIVESLDKIAEREIQERKVQIEKFVDLISIRTELFMVLGILAPITIIIMIFVSNLIVESDLGIQQEITPPQAAVILGLFQLALWYIVIDTKRREPSI